MKIKAKNLESIATWILFAGTIFLVFSIVYFIIICGFADKPSKFNSEVTGNVGSFLSGTVGIIFSIVSVIFFYSALKLQKKELKLQRKELEETRAVFLSQKFENTFFNLLGIQENLRQRIYDKAEKITTIQPSYIEPYLSSIEYTSPEFSGLYSAFKKDCEVFTKPILIRNYQITKRNESVLSFSESKFESVEDYAKRNYQFDLELLNDNLHLKEWIYKRFFDIFQNTLGSYFRTLYHILKLIYDTEISFKSENSELSESDIHQKFKIYADFLQAQMSTDELGLLYYNCLNFPKAKKLVHHYGLIENLCVEDLATLDDALFYSQPNAIDGTEMKPLILKSRVNNSFN